MTMDSNDLPPLPEYRDNPFIARLPAVLSPRQSARALIDLPAYSEAERSYPAHFRFHCLQRLTTYFDPLPQQIELELLMSMLIRQGYLGRNPNTTDFIHRLHNDHERTIRKDVHARLHPVESTASGFALVGVSGIGKTRSVQRILRLYPQVIHHSEPFSLDQVAWLRLECPHKGSAKQLCIAFFEEMDRLLNGRFRARYGGSRSSVEGMLIDMASLADRFALGLLVVDEIQHLTRLRGENRNHLLDFLVALVNTIGIPVMIIGTPAALPVLQGAFRQARRASGLGSPYWSRHPNDATWNCFVERMWRFQWTRTPTPLTDDLRAVLYEESQGIIDIVVKLYMMTQLHVILLGAMAGRETDERLTPALFRHVAKKSFSLVKPMIDALKSGDTLKLAEYDDLKPLNEHLGRIFRESMGQLTLQEATQAAVDARAVSKSAESESVILAALAKVKGDNPGLGTAELMAAVAEALKQPEAPVIPLGTAGMKKAKRTSKPATPANPEDLRVIIANGGTTGISGYTALLKAGVIKPPMQDLMM
ncbi:ATP-binding protein [Azospirillum palustre]